MGRLLQVGPVTTPTPKGFRGGQVKKVYKWKEAIHNISVQLKEVIQKRRYHVRLTSVLSGQK